MGNYKTMNRIYIFLGLMIVIISSCDMKTSNKQNQIKEALGNMTDKDLEPYYENIYDPDSIQFDELKKVKKLTIIDDWTAIELLVNSSKDIKADYLNYMMDEHKTIEPDRNDRLSYMEAGHLGHYIIWKLKKNDTKDFDSIFENAEVVITKGTESAQDLLVVGFFEGIQNVGGWHKVDYYKGFDKWLRPNSKKAWDDLIEGWEGKRP
jgi:predicted helicase